MKISFIPADLHLNTHAGGQFTVTLQGTEIFRGPSSAKAVKKFNKVKKELEQEFPTHELSDTEKKEILQRSIGDYLVKHNTLRTAQKKSARGTRTFG
jgi:hypothetical protein